MAQNASQIEVVLVHGTFARNAPWTLDASPLRKALLAHFGNGVVFKRFVWSGRNSFRARAEATDSLRQFLTESSSHTDHAVHRFVIAHSHGGNVALEALSGPRAAPNVDGLVCLSTPFLSSRRRTISNLANIAISGIGITAAIIVLALSLMLPLAGGAIAALLVVSVFDGAWFVGPLGIGMFLAIPVLLFRKLTNIFIGLRITLPPRTGPEPPLPNPTKILILQSVGDEAAAALAIPRLANRIVTIAFLRPLEAVADLISRSWLALQRWPHLFSKNPRPRWLAWLFLVSALLGGLLAFTPFERLAAILMILVSMLAAYELAPLFALGAVALAVVLLVLPVMVLVFLAFLPFGVDTAFTSLFYEVDANPTPLGNWTVRLIPSTPHLLAHSTTYDNSAAVSAVIDWISSRVWNAA